MMVDDGSEAPNIHRISNIVYRDRRIAFVFCRGPQTVRSFTEAANPSAYVCMLTGTFRKMKVLIPRFAKLVHGIDNLPDHPIRARTFRDMLDRRSGCWYYCGSPSQGRL